MEFVFKEAILPGINKEKEISLWVKSKFQGLWEQDPKKQIRFFIRRETRIERHPSKHKTLKRHHLDVIKTSKRRCSTGHFSNTIYAI